MSDAAEIDGCPGLSGSAFIQAGRESRELAAGVSISTRSLFAKRLLAFRNHNHIGNFTEISTELTLFLRAAGAPIDNNVYEKALKKAIGLMS